MEYKNISYRQMLAKVDENFYKEITSKQEFRNFIDEFVKKFCNENNLKSTQIKTDKFSDYSMYYNPEQNLVYISDFYFDKFETFAKDKNFYFLQNFFNNLVHELRHHIQYTSNEIKPILKNYAALNLFYVSRRYLEKIPYAARPLELDARYYAFKSLRKLKFFSPYYKMDAFKEEENEANYEGFNIVELLKDEDFAHIKFLAQPLNLLKSNINQIAIKNGLQFKKWNSPKQDININLAISKDIAPIFFSDDFYNDLNPNDVEEELNSQQNSFLDYWDEYKKENQND